MTDAEKNQNEELKEESKATEAEAQKTDSSDSTDSPDSKATEEKSDADKIAELQKQNEELKKENADLKDQVLRRAADFDNYRKRTIKEKQETFDYANTNLLKDLLESLDNFDRTVEAAATATDPKAIADGVTMVNKALVSMLENKYNLTSYGNAGDTFDPELHEAIGSKQGDVKEPVLDQVYLKGYKLKDRVIRHAKVMVTMPNA
ncbi:MAG: nucleotide exchange factor GrpE [Treponema sp.]|nr:nucleotide exchange factor GrpE [Treponema sp.]